MRLSDIMSALQLASYAEVALVIFLAVFLTVGLDLLKRKDLEAVRYLPLDDGDQERSSRSTHPH